MLKMSSEIVLAQLILVWQQGMARVHFIPHSCHIHRKSVIVKENLRSLDIHRVLDPTNFYTLLVL